MQVALNKWGNSMAIRLPSFVVNKLGLVSNTKIDLEVSNDQIIIKKISSDLESLCNKITSHNLNRDEVFIDKKGREW